ncbi:MAG: MaoC family dehydratase [bacterium]|nr:MaoC family dehydratase [Acidimicrobiia bacterium]MCY4649376.1 MaoC family dehydratase [bacterium]
MTLADLEGMVIGPEPLLVSGDRVATYVEVTGDQPDRWGEFAPPGMAGAALFAVAPRLLSHPAVMAEGGAAVHGEQVFCWKAPLRAQDTWSVGGEVSRVRHRRGVWFVDFAVTVEDSDGGIMVEGRSSFLIAGGQPPARGTAVETEPAALHRAANQPAAGAGLPGVGGDIPILAKSASRADLIRYGAVTRDWNPIHWDHQSAVGAGFSGVVVHGLACAAWICQGVTRLLGGPSPLGKARFRFRQPLRPGVPAHVEGRRTGETRFAMRLVSEGNALITASVDTAAV